MPPMVSISGSDIDLRFWGWGHLPCGIGGRVIARGARAHRLDEKARAETLHTLASVRHPPTSTIASSTSLPSGTPTRELDTHPSVRHPQPGEGYSTPGEGVAVHKQRRRGRRFYDLGFSVQGLWLMA